ncbi:hypothetical protein W911_12560 [Hyphomicrobium nitrativorans NL23]|uniref:Uncharacterized protein n=1 Tax=Hyphomicrobium nitrativorans NL23 TaxID=1029756 RepID=V5SI96_9HYPH|nr:hypothetical protein W911_12560 [Hyphomicrobium nitrativorans NL23]
MPEACFQHDAAIDQSCLTAEPRGSFARLVHAGGVLPARRKVLQTMRFAATSLLPAEQKPSRRDAILIGFGA